MMWFLTGFALGCFVTYKYLTRADDGPDGI
jgi:hypothetical protein